MAVFTAKPIILLEENQYVNFVWIGEMEDGCLLCRWDEEALVDKRESNQSNSSLAMVTQIAITTHDLQNSQVLYTFDKVTPVVQATVNSNKTLIGFVVRAEEIDNTSKYSAYVAEILPQRSVFSLNIDSSKQIILEFLHTEILKKTSSKTSIAKLLVFLHRESISVYSFSLEERNKKWVVEDEPLTEMIVRSFIWAQWDPSQLHLYYLHQRPTHEAGLALGLEGEEDTTTASSMLTALQFHANSPHETVLNVPLELSGLEHTLLDPIVALDYRDLGLLHTIGDPGLDLRILTSASGTVSICYHYIYKSRLAETPVDPESYPVYLAYSITLLHHGCVLHAVVPSVPWLRAQNASPTYSLFSDHYLLVIIPGVSVHILDIGLEHLPTNHIIGPTQCDQILPNSQLCQLQGASNKMSSSRTLNFIDVANHLRIEVRVSKESLFQLFKTSQCVNTKLAILHMSSVHDRDHDLTRKLIRNVCEDLYNLNIPALLQEYLVGETFAAVSKHIDSDALHLISLLPITTSPFITDIEYMKSPLEEKIRISYCMLENACIMLLSPRERLVRGVSDTWMKLWDHISSKHHERFSLNQVVEKLLVSLDTYKPEALSIGTTPLSPASPLVGGLTVASLGLTLSHLMFDPLPFNEVEHSTSSKLEHLLSVNLRELSMYCLKYFPHESPMRVHAVASKYVCTQLQTLVPDDSSEKGFTFIEQLGEGVAWCLFVLIERYHIATDAVAYPLPQGYNSFVAYLAYKCLSHSMFMQYVKRGVLQLNVDVLREIIYDLDDSPANVKRKLEIVSSVPLVRGLRTLQYWQHPDSLLLRSRHHAASILAGEGPGHPKNQSTRTHSKAACRRTTEPFPTGDRNSPFETFLDLLTAKANLSDLDLCLLHDGTVASVELGRKLLNVTKM